MERGKEEERDGWERNGKRNAVGGKTRGKTESYGEEGRDAVVGREGDAERRK